MTLTNRKLSDVRDRIQEILSTAAKERNRRPDVVNTAHGPELEWEVHEWTVVLDEVNRVRAEQGWEPISIEAVAKADRTHSGYCDWFEKFTFDCARLAVHEVPHRRT